MTTTTFYNTTATCLTKSTGVFQLLLSQLVSTLLKAPCDIPASYPADCGVKALRTTKFDFIIIGAGSSGSVISNRLTETRHWNILLIEAGDDPPIESDIPAFFPFALNSDISYKYFAEKSANSCGALLDERCFLPRGKTLGGSSSINAMIYARGDPEDYDAWSNAGNNGWDYENVLPYFKKLESDNVEDVRSDSHGYSGYQHVEYFPPVTEKSMKLLRDSLYEAVAELGLPVVDDIAVNPLAGIGRILGTVKRGVRQSAARSYLAPIKDRKNFYLLKQAHVTKILIDSKKRARGVRVFRDNVYTDVFVEKEVIVSAGAINSPQLLMLSGLGPAEHLRQFGIKTVHDLRVGYNLQDHVAFLGAAFTYKGHDERTPPDNGLQMMDDLYAYLTRRQQLGSLGGMESVLYLDTTGGSPQYPNVQSYFLTLPGRSLQLSAFFETMRMKPEITKMVLGLDGEYVMFPVMALLRPKSSGRVYLKSTDPFDAVRVNVSYFENEADREALLEGIRFLERLNTTDVFRRRNITLQRVEVEGCSKDWRCQTQHMTSTAFHQVGTCKMGPVTDPESVVDSTLKVHGVRGLRVADASIMPKIVSGNTNAPCMMIGEKASDMIKEEWTKNTRDEF